MLGIILFFSCNQVEVDTKRDMAQVWLTMADNSLQLSESEFEKHSIKTIDIQSLQSHKTLLNAQNKGQSLIGFGFTLTGGSARLIQGLPYSKKT